MTGWQESQGVYKSTGKSLREFLCDSFGFSESKGMIVCIWCLWCSWDVCMCVRGREEGWLEGKFLEIIVEE